MSDERINLAYIGRALQRLANEVASLRDDMGDRVRRIETTEAAEK
jgi:hypothetical protein